MRWRRMKPKDDMTRSEATDRLERQLQGLAALLNDAVDQLKILDARNHPQNGTG